MAHVSVPAVVSLPPRISAYTKKKTCKYQARILENSVTFV